VPGRTHVLAARRTQGQRAAASLDQARRQCGAREPGWEGEGCKMLQHLLCTTAESKRLPGVWWVCQGQGGCPHAESLITVCEHHISFRVSSHLGHSLCMG